MPQIRTLILALASTACLLNSPSLLAHSDEVLDTQKAPNGGQLRMAGPYHFELVVISDSKEVRENPIVVHVTDHAGARVSTAGASATATLLAGKIKATSTLAPDGDNRLKGFAKYASTSDMKVVVTVTLAGKAAEQARFTPLAVSQQERR
ncbi:MAG TPA: hypothetical protein PL117_12540 [Accumulibacter sp.]|uniref:hypothetical protein n=1 Tax=Accumulibacter sp. TaxID=2053492 RepID=UPI002C8982CC|nr:hypothetical protein [Accumulibacter sp.]HRF73593.1 hypothetical protein [Accumulibacter sp.]